MAIPADNVRTEPDVLIATVTRRSLVIGIVMAAWVNLWPAYASLMMHSTRADHAHLPVAMLIPYLFLLVGNIFWERYRRGLSSSELITICCMGMVAACMQGEWLANFFLEALTMPHYFSSPENRWDDFHVLAIVQAGVFNRFGLEMGSVDPWGSFHPAVGWQSFGGMIVFVAWGLWIGRSHLKDVFRKATVGDDAVDDSDELMSDRTAVFLTLVCTLYVLLWLYKAGMAWGPILAFWFSTMVLYFGLARIMVESGLIFLRGPITAQAFTWHLFGVLGMGPQSAVVLTLTNAFACDAKTFAMTPMAHVPRLSMAMNPQSRKILAPGVLVGSLIGAATVIGFILYFGYQVMGSYNFGTVSFRGLGALNLAGFNRLAASRIQAGAMGTSWDRIGFMGVGALVSGALFLLRYRFPGFPLHPIGFTISASAPLRNTTLTIFLVWALKSIVLRLGGLERYRSLTPLFLGMMVAYMAGTALGVIVDLIWFPGNGHMIHVAW